MLSRYASFVIADSALNPATWASSSGEDENPLVLYYGKRNPLSNVPIAAEASQTPALTSLPDSFYPALNHQNLYDPLTLASEGLVWELSGQLKTITFSLLPLAAFPNLSHAKTEQGWNSSFPKFVTMWNYSSELLLSPSNKQKYKIELPREGSGKRKSGIIYLVPIFAFRSRAKSSDRVLWSRLGPQWHFAGLAVPA